MRFDVAPSRALRAALDSHLQLGERIVWIGGPDPIVMLRTQLPLWWVGVPLTALGIALAVADLLPSAFKMVPIIIGLVFMATPLLMLAVAVGTVYAITNRRVMINRDAIGIRSFDAFAFADLDRKLEILDAGRGGHLYFASTRQSDQADADYTGRVALRALARPHDVADVLERARAPVRPG